MERITKTFPGVRALDRVDFEVAPGEIHALLGANGAGKSTLMKILSGAYVPDEGTIVLDGKKLTIRRPADALREGIFCVYQEVDTVLAGGLTVAENVFLDRMAEGGRNVWISWRELNRRTSQLLSELGMDIAPDTLVRELSIAQKQMVLIARAMMQKSRVVIFDEPTAPLSAEEASTLFRIMNKMKADGLGCIFISHRLPEVFEICDRITVMRDGKTISTRRTETTSVPEVIRDMLGKSFEEEFPKEAVAIGDPLLEVRNLSGGKVKDVSFTVRSGEIVAVAGLVGAGKTELSRLLFAADAPEKGEIRLRGRKLAMKTPGDAINGGIVLVPEERRKQGILVNESVRDNLTLASLPAFSPLGFLRGKQENRHAEQMVEKLGVKTPGIFQKVGLLSGGNQQKVVIGKWLPLPADIYLFDEPTKGIDVGAKSEVFRLIGALAKQGKGIVYFSSEWAEILGIADRILVMCDGRIVKEMVREEASNERIMFYASGGKEEAAE
jgi:simple sugar transport system ATP-binding protein